MEQREWKGVTGGGRIGQAGLRMFLKYFDVRLCYVPLLFIIPFYFVFAYKRAASIYHYFRRRQYYGPIKSFFKTYLNHFYFGQLVLDRFAIFAGQGSKFKIVVSGQNYWDEANADDKGCVVIGSHIGNFEIAGYLLGKPVKKMNCLVYAKEARKMQKYRTRTLGNNDISLVPIMDDMSHIFQINEILQRHEIISMTCDRFTPGSKVVDATFLDGAAHFPIGAFHIGAVHDVNMIAVFVMKEKLMQYHVYVCPIKVEAGAVTRQEKIDSFVRAYIAEMEGKLYLYPEQWYNFYEFWDD